MISRSGTPRSSPTSGGDRHRPDRQLVNIKCVRAMRAKHAAIDDHARGATFLADCKRRNDDMGSPAVLFQRAGMTYFSATLLSLTCRYSRAGRNGKQCHPRRSRRHDRRHRPAANYRRCSSRRLPAERPDCRSRRARNGLSLPLDEHVGPHAWRRQSETESDDDQAEGPRLRPPQAEPKPPKHQRRP